MSDPARLLEQNRRWAQRIKRDEPGLIEGLAAGQAPTYLWIGCVDSRVQPATLTDTRPGELFVHRNIANAVVADDTNAQAVIQFAVDVLRVSHIIVCGHYGCGGIEACTQALPGGFLGQWLRHLRAVTDKHAHRVDADADAPSRLDRLAELNVIEQAYNLACNPSVQHAWERGQTLTVHGWIYSVADGLLSDLGVTIAGADHAHDAYQRALDTRTG